MTGIARFYSFIVLIKFCESARILAIIPTPSYSHQIAFQPLWKELSLRGHEITVITTHPLNDPTLTNLTEIDTSFSSKNLTDALVEIIENSNNPFKYLTLAIHAAVAVIDSQFGHPSVKILIEDESVHFDLVIGEYLYATPVVLSKRFNSPYIGILPLDGHNEIYVYSGNPTHSVLYPNVLLFPEKILTLQQRISAVIFKLVFEIACRCLLQLESELTQKHFGKDYNLKELLGNVSILFMKRDPVFHIPRPLNPNVILIGGKSQRMPSKSLSKDLQRYLDDSEDGFIYFSLGSSVNSKDMPYTTISVIVDTFKELPYKILWKYELDSILQKPDNVMINKWVPQLEVLQHPNIKLFITHCGAQSMAESIAARVPMLAMPVLSDQPNNAAKMVNRGLSLSIDYRTLEKHHFKDTILELINNPKYVNRIKELADLAEDQPMTGLEVMVWWTEYVLRHKGAAHLKSNLFGIPWYQYYYVDVFLVMALGITISVYSCVKLLRIVCKVSKCILFTNKRKHE